MYRKVKHYFVAILAVAILTVMFGLFSRRLLNPYPLSSKVIPKSPLNLQMFQLYTHFHNEVPKSSVPLDEKKGESGESKDSLLAKEVTAVVSKDKDKELSDKSILTAPQAGSVTKGNTNDELSKKVYLGNETLLQTTGKEIKLVHSIQISRNQPSSATLNTTKGKLHPQQKEKVILIYTTLFFKSRWVDLNDDQIIDYPQRANCPHADTCKLTYDKNTIDYADGVLFHGVDLVKSYPLSSLQESIKRRPPHQRWIFLMQENPYYYNNFKNYTGLFNWTFTYEHRSDMVFPYNHYRPLTEEEVKAFAFRNYAEEKNKLAIWFASNCENHRIEYVKIMKKWMNVSIYGYCAYQFGTSAGECKKFSKKCTNIIKEHKFFLAFENAFCLDYITEKFWDCLTHYDIVPVVMGANYDRYAVPPGSFIDTADFPTVKELTNYLLYLDKNNTAYNEYFQWKMKYKIRNRDKICILCEHIHKTDIPRKNYENVWSYEHSCKQYENKKKTYKKMIENG